jgi:hypothetical protein
LADPGSDLRSWVLAMPPGEILNSNDRGHWGRRHDVTALLRGYAIQAARRAKVPHRALPGIPAAGRAVDRARITAVFHPADHRRRDPSNLNPLVKGYVDGLVAGFGLLPDDDTWHLLGPDLRAGDLAVPVRRGLPALPWMELRIRELPPLAVLRCRSAVAARQVAAGAPKLAPTWPDADLEHRARVDGRTVILMFTDPQFLADVTVWARASSRLADSVTR